MSGQAHAFVLRFSGDVTNPMLIFSYGQIAINLFSSLNVDKIQTYQFFGGFYDC